MDKEAKKKYCDKNFKTQLAKALKINAGEPDNLDKIRNNRHLSSYSSDKIIAFTNNVSADVQKFVNSSIIDPRSKEILALTNIMDEESGGQPPYELPLLMKLHSNSDKDLDFRKLDGVHFETLSKFLYLAVNGSVDFTDMNEPTKKVLYDTYEMLLEQVDKDSRLEDLKSKIGTGCTKDPPKNVSNLNQVFQDTKLNPFNLPFEYFLNGTLPE